MRTHTFCKIDNRVRETMYACISTRELCGYYSFKKKILSDKLLSKAITYRHWKKDLLSENFSFIEKYSISYIIV